MSIPTMQDQFMSPEAAFKMRLDFAQRAFTNAQELTRLMDQKANYLLSAVALLTAALGIVASKALDIKPTAGWELVVKGLSIVLFLGYLVLAFAVVYNATRVFRARSSMLTGQSAAPGMLFPLILLSRFSTNGVVDENKYLIKLGSLTPEEILHDYANQIIEVSTIYSHKQQNINLSLTLFYWLTITWIMAILLLLALIVVS